MYLQMNYVKTNMQRIFRCKSFMIGKLDLREMSYLWTCLALLHIAIDRIWGIQILS